MDDDMQQQKQKTIRIKMLGKPDRVVDLSENILTESTVKSQFLIPADAVVRLWYKVDGKEIGCKVRRVSSEPCFILPDGWDKIEFHVESTSAMNETQAKALTTEDVAKYFDYLFYFINGQYRICVTIVDANLAIAAGHCIPKDKKKGDYLTIYDQSNKSYEVEIIFLNRELDLALLKPVVHVFNVKPLEIGSYGVGIDYFVLGYPLDEDTGQQFVKSPSAIKGCIMTRTVRGNCVYGDSGGSKGFSGGPVISLNHPRALIGISLKGRGLPQSWPLNDFLARMLTFCSETPRLKILPAATAVSFASVDNVDKRGGIKRSRSYEDIEKKIKQSAMDENIEKN